jgi:hypothetical protein
MFRFTIQPTTTTTALSWIHIFLVMVILVAAVVTGQSNVTVFNPIRINCGGARYTDPTTGIRWLADTYNLGNKGRTVNQCNVNTTIITNLITVPPSSLRPIYCTNRFYRSLGSSPTQRDIEPYQYNIPVPSVVNNSVALYTVRLHFADLVRTRVSVYVCVCVRAYDGSMDLYRSITVVPSHILSRIIILLLLLLGYPPIHLNP